MEGTIGKRYTTQQVAEILGIGRSTVTYYACRLGFERSGRDYILTDEQVGQIRARLVRAGRGA